MINICVDGNPVGGEELLCDVENIEVTLPAGLIHRECEYCGEDYGDNIDETNCGGQDCDECWGEGRVYENDSEDDEDEGDICEECQGTGNGRCVEREPYAPFATGVNIRVMVDGVQLSVTLNGGGVLQFELRRDVVGNLYMHIPTTETTGNYIKNIDKISESTYRVTQ